ncbi:hypothetical protein V2G26_006343 [Clonostachys chloroleuca]|uniref:Uncharacterized protein n=1 Tax=Clonostachys chloroleuca TaxID=1926264 RepID=A0AA35Q4N0_9HYPO|nr:unnamed protein product [Clonostachys chloroleuca]
MREITFRIVGEDTLRRRLENLSAHRRGHSSSSMEELESYLMISGKDYTPSLLRAYILSTAQRIMMIKPHNEAIEEDPTFQVDPDIFLAFFPDQRVGRQQLRKLQEKERKDKARFEKEQRFSRSLGLS